MKNDVVIDIARKLEFDLIGFAKADKLTDEVDLLRQWLNNNYNAGMEYMERNIDKRLDIQNILPGAKSIISLGINYYKNQKALLPENSGKVSKYAWGKDYHYVIWEKLEIFEEKLKEIFPSIETKSYVDTGPVMEKIWAYRAGLGWIGKHSNVISNKIGSWFFIANIITTEEFSYSETIKDYCGSCTRCIDACPTQAIVAPRTIDANKCISYLTIENKGEIASEFKGKFDNWAFGCDICQDVCPWNIKLQKPALNKELSDNENMFINSGDVKEMTNSQFKKKYFTSPIYRAKLKGIRRNLEFLESSSETKN